MLSRRTTCLFALYFEIRKKKISKLLLKQLSLNLFQPGIIHLLTFYCLSIGSIVIAEIIECGRRKDGERCNSHHLGEEPEKIKKNLLTV